MRQMISDTSPLWEEDGMRVLEQRCEREMLQILFSVQPSISPQFLATRAKGRLDYSARKVGAAVNFSRKLAICSVGDSTRRDVEWYLSRQVSKEAFADPRFEAQMASLTVANSEVDLSRPVPSLSGRYWYNVHLVLVADKRERIHDTKMLTDLRDATLRVARKKGHLLSRLAVMPDHLHLAVRPLISESALGVAFAYQNNLAHMLGGRRIWQDSFYVGTFGEYSMQAVRRHAD
jgi:REP element-mobilizing transposase RayT